MTNMKAKLTLLLEEALASLRLPHSCPMLTSTAVPFYLVSLLFL